MAISLRDFLTFPFNEGRGIRMSQVDGVQTHLVSSGWDDPDDPQHLIISPTLATQPDQMLLFMRLPFAIPRTDRNLTARIGAQNVERPLVGINGGAVKPRELTPGALHGMLIDTGAARFVEVLPPRPQDYTLVVSWLPQPPYDQAQFEAFVSDPANHGTSTTDMVTVPAWTGTDGNAQVGRVFGAPLDAPDLDFIETTSIVSSSRITPWDGREFMGTPYKWWNLRRIQGLFAQLGAVTYRVEFLSGT